MMCSDQKNMWLVKNQLILTKRKHSHTDEQSLLTHPLLMDALHVEVGSTVGEGTDENSGLCHVTS